MTTIANHEPVSKAMPLSAERKDPRRALRSATVHEEGDLLLRVSGILPAGEFGGFVCRIAGQLHLRGWIRPDGAGALLRAAGTEEQLVRLVRALYEEAPPSARIRQMDPEAIAADTPAIGPGFVPLVDMSGDWHDPNPSHPPLPNVA